MSIKRDLMPWLLWLLFYQLCTAADPPAGQQDVQYNHFIDSFVMDQTQDVVDRFLLSEYFDRHLRGKHLVFMGDSVTRYQYLGLVYSIKRNKWSSSDEHPSMSIKSFDGWEAFLNGTNQMLQPYERCDCYRPVKYNTMLMFENRYYIDRDRDITISYLLFNGNITGRSFVQGHWHSDQDPDSDRSPHGYYIEPKWNYHIVDVFPWLANITGKHRPLIIVMNNGHHQHEFNDHIFANRVASAAKKYAQQFIWKTTTARRTVVDDSHHAHVIVPGIAHQAHDQYMCSIDKVGCLNLTWTERLSPDIFMDDWHFSPQVNNVFNVELLKILASFS